MTPWLLKEKELALEKSKASGHSTEEVPSWLVGRAVFQGETIQGKVWDSQNGWLLMAFIGTMVLVGFGLGFVFWNICSNLQIF